MFRHVAKCLIMSLYVPHVSVCRAMYQNVASCTSCPTTPFHVAQYLKMSYMARNFRHVNFRISDKILRLVTVEKVVLMGRRSLKNPFAGLTSKLPSIEMICRCYVKTLRLECQNCFVVYTVP